MKPIKQLLLFILTVALHCNVFSQGGSVKNVPVIYQNGIKYSYNNHVYFAGGQEAVDYKQFSDKQYIKKGQYWNVFAVRAKVPILDKPGGEVKWKADFSTIFWVTENSADYLYVQDDLDGQGKNGWCHKDNLILWKTPLTDRETNIELKAFMVNNLINKDIIRKIRENKEQYQIYDGPGKDAGQLQIRMIYDVFFVYKYENPDNVPNGGRYLLSEHLSVSGSRKLLGWVDEARVKLWRTSLCLEPNFDPVSMAERNKNGIMATVFTESFGGREHAGAYRMKGSTGKGLVRGKLRDPAMGDFRKEPRMYGNIFRYPIFQGYYTDANKLNTEYITGVTGKSNMANSGVVEGFDDEVYTRFSKTRDRLNAEMHRENVVFVIDGTAGMKNYINELASLLNNIQDANAAENINTRRYGAVLYKNEFNNQSIEQNSENDFCQIFELTNNAKELAQQLTKYQVGEAGDPGERESVHYALKKAIGLLKPDQTNILIHMGNSPDNSEDFLWSSVKNSTLVTYNDIAKLLSKDVNLHYINFVTFSTEVQPSTRKLFYKETAERLIPDMATALSNKFAGLSFAKDLKQPETPRAASFSSPEYEATKMYNSPFQFKTYMLKDYHLRTVTSNILAEIDSCRSKTHEFLESLNAIVEDTGTLSERADDFSINIVNLTIHNLMKDEEGDEAFWIDTQEWMANAKVHIFVDAITYHKTEVMNEPLFKYVLFMHEEQLVNKLRELGKLVSDLEGGEDPQKVLIEHWQRMAEQTLSLSSKTDKFTIEELKNKMLGIDKMELILPQIFGNIGGKSIGDLQKSKGLSSSAEMMELIRYFRKSYEEIETLRRSQYFYRIPDTDTKFYWVPLEYIFG